MKNLSKTLGIVIGLPILYILISFFVEFIFIAINITTNNIGIIKNHVYSMSLIADLIMITIMFLIFLPTKQKLINICNFKKIKLVDIFYIIFLAIGMGLISSVLIGILTNFTKSYDNVVNTITIADKSNLQLVIVIFLSPIFEEILYRGIIFRYLKKNYNIIISIVLQALIFGIIHLNIIQSIYTFFLGIALALTYLYRESIIECIIFHIIYNLFGVLVANKLILYNHKLYSIVVILGIIISVLLAINLIRKCIKDKSIT